MDEGVQGSEGTRRPVKLGSCWDSLGHRGGKPELRPGWRDGERGLLRGTSEVKSAPDGWAIVADEGEEGHGDSQVSNLGDWWRQNA